MAVTLTADQLAAELRIGDGTTPLVEPMAGIMDRLLGACSEIVEHYAPAAPESVQNRAVVRLAGYEYDASPTSNRFRNGFQNSGAQSLLASYRVARAVLVE